MKRCLCVIGAIGLLSVAGCSDDGQLATYPVTGTVKYKGEPVADASVAFVPEAQGQPSSFGRTQSDGTYSLTTYEAGDGAPAGKYKITVTKYEQTAVADQGSGTDESDPNYEPPPDNPKPQAAPKSLVPPKYTSVLSSGLTAEVTSGDNKVDLELTD